MPLFSPLFRLLFLSRQRLFADAARGFSFFAACR